MSIKEDQYQTGLKLAALIERRNILFEKAVVITKADIKGCLDYAYPPYNADEKQLFLKIEELQSAIDDLFEIAIANGLLLSLHGAQSCEVVNVRKEIFKHFGIDEKQWIEAEMYIKVCLEFCEIPVKKILEDYGD